MTDFKMVEITISIDEFVKFKEKTLEFEVIYQGSKQKQEAQVSLYVQDKYDVKITQFIADPQYEIVKYIPIDIIAEIKNMGFEKIDIDIEIELWDSEGNSIIDPSKFKGSATIEPERVHRISKNISSLKSQGSNHEMQYFSNLRKFFLFKEVFFKIDTQRYRYEISDQFFLENDGFIAKNYLFEKIKKMYFCYNYSGIITREFCLGATKIDQESSSGFDYTLYS